MQVKRNIRKKKLGNTKTGENELRNIQFFGI